MSKMSNEHVRLCEENGGIDPNDIDIDLGSPPAQPPLDLLGACEVLVNVSGVAMDYLDDGSGYEAGKLLKALSGNLHGYRNDVDRAHAAIDKARGK